MNYEKAYKEALEKARDARQNTESAVTIGILEEIFPELKESEDERIRTKLLNLLKELLELGGVAQDTWSMKDCEQFIDWLEKQGEQKPAWSEEDDIGLDDALWCCKQAASIAKDENDMGNTWYAEKWLKSLKQRMGE